MESHRFIGEQAALAELFAALAEAQGELGGVIAKNRTVVVRHKSGGQHSYAYATLDTILAKAVPLLSSKGLALIQFPVSHERTNILITSLVHKSGARLEVEMALPSSSDIQDLGKSITYMRRYVVQSVLGLAAEEDSDGPGREGEDRRSSKPRQGASDRAQQRRPPKQEQGRQQRPQSDQQAGAKEARQVKAMLEAKRAELGEKNYREVVPRDPTNLAEAKAACLRLEKVQPPAAPEAAPASEVVQQARQQKVENWQNEVQST